MKNENYGKVNDMLYKLIGKKSYVYTGNQAKGPVEKIYYFSFYDDILHLQMGSVPGQRK